MQSQWFVIHTLSGQEQKVKESIEKRIKTEEMGEFIKEVLVPMEKVVEVRNQKKTVSTRKLHPGYVYINMALLDENNRVIPKPCYFIKETQGVIGFVGGEPPVPTPSDEVESIKAQISASEETEKPKVNFEVGETVKINNGPVPEFQRRDRGNRSGSRQTESDGEYFRAQHAGGTGILAGGKSLKN